MLVGYMRVSSTDDRQSVSLQKDALVASGVDERHLHQDKASGARDDRPGLKGCLSDLRPGDVLVVWKLDRLGRSLPNLLAIIADFKERGVAFRSLTEQMDTTTPHGELLFSIFGALAQYERALTRERVLAGLAAAKRRGRKGGRPQALGPEQIEQVVAALNGGASKASVCRSFKVPRSTLLNTLTRIGWTGLAASPLTAEPDMARKRKEPAAKAFAAKPASSPTRLPTSPGKEG
ncbi:MAG: recombinase family protein [Janthinobacterium lividum]